MTFEARNPLDEGQDCFLTSYFKDREQQQFGRRFWIPPQSVLKSWYLAKTPPADINSAEQDGLPLNWMLVESHGEIESATSIKGSKSRIEDNLIRVRKNAFKTLLIAEPDDHESPKFVAAARIAQSVPRDFLSPPVPVFPPEAAGYEQWTHIALATDQILADPAGLEALRQWVVQGGNLWILLDKTGPETALPLIADQGGLAVVDRVGLTSFQMTDAAANFDLNRAVREFETPVEMVRVIPEGFQVLCRVSGWSAALALNVGRGKILITTVGAQGWLQPRDEANWRRQVDLDETAFPTPECRSLGDVFWAANFPDPPLSLAGTASRYVGYRVTSLSWVATILAVFCGSALVLALVFWKQERLAWLAGSVPLLALAATLAIGVSGYRNRSAVPPTEASMQIAEFDALGQVHVQGAFSVNSVANGDTQPETTAGGRLEFENPPPGVAKRFVWTDYGKTHWENLDLNTGIHEFHFTAHDRRKPGLAVISLNEQGVIGRISDTDWELPQRGLIVSPTGQWASPRFLEDGQFVSTVQDRLTTGQFTASDVIDDREQTRIEVLRHLFAENQHLPDQPRFYFWTAPWETGMRTQTEGQRVGDTLVGLPMVFERPPGGSSVYCPDYLVGFRSISFRARGASLAYDNRRRVWHDLLTRPSTTTLEFQLPKPLGRFKLDRLRLFIDINAPNRDLQLLAFDKLNPGEKQLLSERKSPVGIFEFDLAGESLPPLHEDLTFVLGLDVGPLLDGSEKVEDADPAKHGWQFRNLWAEAWGTVLE